MSRKVVYLAGPFRAVNPDGSPDMFRVQQNVMRAMALGLHVWKAGHVALIPHANSWCFQGASGLSDRVWLDGDLELLTRCDALLVTPDFARSQGALEELRFARARNMPAFLDLSACLAWLAEDTRVTDGPDGCR